MELQDSPSALSPNQFEQMVRAGARMLEANIELINELHVFPVLDGDTGTNMYLTMVSVLEELDKLQEKSFLSIAKAITMGSLMGAKGNSGVILSQIFRGMCDVISASEEVSADVLAEALEKGREVAYQAVIKPVEGTMLTVISDISTEAKRSKGTADIREMFERIVAAAKESVKRTTSLLPVLKEAGVVDAGGQGLALLFEGFLAYLNGKASDVRREAERPAAGPPQARLSEETMEEELRYAYCTEFVLRGEGLDAERLRAALGELGDSVMVVGDKKVLKVHVHTNRPDVVLGVALEVGSLHEIQINNMVDQTAERIQGTLAQAVQSAKESEKPTQKGVALIAVCHGSGFREIFESIGVDVVINGGQTMNPSTGEIARAISSMEANKVVVLPNNKNIQMAAEQAAKVCDKEVHVIPTKSIPQGISAVLAFNEALDFEENLADMKHAASRVITGEVTSATRDAQSPIGPIRKGEFIGLVNDEICSKGLDLAAVAVETAKKMCAFGGEVLTIYWGDQVDAREAEQLASRIKTELPDVDVQVYFGGQPLYPYILSLE